MCARERWGPHHHYRGANQSSKGYLELGGKGEGELQTSREAKEEEDTDGDEVVELLNVSDSEGSLRSQYLDLSIVNMHYNKTKTMQLYILCGLKRKIESLKKKYREDKCMDSDSS